MEIINERPPIYDRVAEIFPLSGNEIFAWGDKIYNPSGGRISTALLAHEETHQRQQGKAVEKWWDRYLIDPEFRFEMELDAHQVEYRTFCNAQRDRNKRAQYLQMVARRLSAPMYGSLLTRTEAVQAIRRGTCTVK